MAHGAFRIFDCDLHVVEPPDLWQKYIDPQYKSVAPVGLSEYPVDLRIRVGEKVRPRNSLIRPPADKKDAFYIKRERRFGEAHRRGWGSDVQLEAMDAEGVDLAVLFPSRGLWVIADDEMDPSYAAAIARAYNNWLADFCRYAPNRLYVLRHEQSHPGAVWEMAWTRHLYRSGGQLLAVQARGGR